MFNLLRNHKKDESGFTLVEILVTIVIVGILAAISVPIYLNHQNTARIATLKSDITSTAGNLSTYFSANDAFSASGDGTKIVVQSSGNTVRLGNVGVTGTGAPTQANACVEGTRVIKGVSKNFAYSLQTRQLTENKICSQLTSTNLPAENVG